MAAKGNGFQAQQQLKDFFVRFVVEAAEFLIGQPVRAGASSLMNMPRYFTLGASTIGRPRGQNCWRRLLAGYVE